MADNSDLESYLDELEKHIEEDIAASVCSEVANVEEAEEEAKDEGGGDEDVDDDDYALDDAELEDGTIFMDEEGNYYYQSGKKAVQVKPVKKEKSIIKTVAAAVKKRKLSQSPPRSAKKEKLNTSNKSTKQQPTSPTKTPRKTTARNKTTGGNNSILKYLDVKSKSKETSSEKSASPEKSNAATKTEAAATQKPAQKRGPRAKAIKTEPKTEDISTITTDANETVSTVDQTLASEAEVNEEVYNFDETERTVDAGDCTVDENGEHDPLVQNQILLKPLNVTADAEGQYKCQICEYSTNKKFLLTRHFKTHSDDRPYKCSVCERGFKSHNSLMNHINTHLGNKPHACGDCDMSFTTSGELTRHRRYKHTGVKPHKCTECDYSSVELSKLRRHIRCHTGERPYQCPHCTYASPDTFKLKRHMRTHTGEKPYECDICHARFTQSNSLKYHRLIHSVNDKPLFQCSLCPTTCGRKTDLRLHIQKLHNSDKPYPCKRCGKELPDRYQYKMHVKTHEGEKCFRCTYCPYASISQRHLETHMLIHTDSKPYVCEHCQQCFRQKQLLSRHIKIYHTANYEPPKPLKKAHACPHCDRSFAFKGNLMRHMESHDPNSKINEEKLRLKLGRLKRVQPDGTVVTQIKSSFIYNEAEVVNGEGEPVHDNDGNVIYEDENGQPIQYVYEDYEPQEEEEEEVEMEDEEVEYDEDYQELEYFEPIDDKSDIVIKTEKITVDKTTAANTRLINLPSAINVKKEEHSADSMPATEDDGFMIIEVVNDGEEPNEQELQEYLENSQRRQPKKMEAAARNPISKSNTSALKAITEDCFGFEDDAEEDEVPENTNNNESLELIEMLQE
ncbi:CTCF [Musca autumnalis]|uniref:CTCF n=1 Tax=Musca autumnalis TaxID=221902 RepID=UPI003CF21589